MKLDYRNLGEALGIDFKEYFRSDLENLKSLESDGLVDTRDNGLIVTDFGRLLIRNIAVVFDAYSTEKEKAFSRSI